MSLKDRLRGLTPKIEQLRLAAGNAGLSIGVIQNDDVLYEDHFGVQDVRSTKIPNGDTIYHIGSLTKCTTAAGLAILVDEGKLAWDDRLIDVVPGFHQRSKDVQEKATITDLLAHRLGLPQRMNYWVQMEQELLVPAEEAVNVLGALHPAADFRSTIKYNNWTYTIAGLLIERLSGLSLQDFMHVHLIKPLGLRRTTFNTVSDENFAGCHITLSNRAPFSIPRPNIVSGTVLGASAGMKTSVNDMLKIYSTLLEAYHDQKASGKTSTPGNPFRHAEFIFTPHNKKGTTQYGLGLFITDLPAEIGWLSLNDGRVAQNPTIAKGIKSTRIAYHNASMNGALSSVHMIPESSTAIVILDNGIPFADLPDYVGGLILETILETNEPTEFMPLVLESKMAAIERPIETARQLEAERKHGTSHKPLQEYEGRYMNAEGNFFLDVEVRGDGLRMRLQGLPLTYYDLYHYHDDIFAWKCDRDAEARRAMFPMLSVAFRKVCFLEDANETISQIHWAYARDEPMGEIFTKVAGSK